MKSILQKFLDFFRLYKWLLLLIVPVVIFLFFIPYIFTNPSPEQMKITPTPSPTIPTSPEQTSTDNNIEDYELDSIEEYNENLEVSPDFSGYEKKEVLSNGNIIYSYPSINTNRPNIVITTDSSSILFLRKLPSEDYKPASIDVFQQAYGNPEKIISGSKTYGQQSSIYIYGELGLAFIGNKQTGEVYEEHFFVPMSPDAYIQRYGNQN